MKNSRVIIAVLALSLFFCCAGCSQHAANTKNPAANSYWESSTPAAEGIDPAVINAIHQEITAGKYGLIDHFLVIRNGKIVADHNYTQNYDSVMNLRDTTTHQYNYDNTTWHPYYNQTNLHTLQSVTKSITAILLGIAIDEGLVSPIDSSFTQYFNDYTFDRSDKRKRALSIRHLLTMQSGIKWDEENYDRADNSCILMEESDNWIQFILNQPMDDVPGTLFNYNSGASVLLGKIVRMATGKRIDEWAEEKLFKPLAITDYYWKVTPDGEIDTEGGLYLTTHDLAKIGYLMLHQGLWGNQQIISKDWVHKLVQPWVAFNETSGYGFQWWIPLHKDGKAEIFAGNGYGGQFLMVAPQYDLIVVFNGWNIHDQPEKSTWGVLQDRILPATRLLK